MFLHSYGDDIMAVFNSPNYVHNPTDKGVYCNYVSHTAEMNKRSVIKTLVFRALKYTSNWPLFQAEIVRLKQLFCNNNYPQHLVESIIQSSVTKFLDPQQKKKKKKKTLQ